MPGLPDDGGHLPLTVNTTITITITLTYLQAQGGRAGPGERDEKLYINEWQQTKKSVYVVM